MKTILRASALCFMALGRWAIAEHPSVINFGYNKFVPSHYSHEIAVVTFDSDQGIARFERSKFKKAFFKLAPHYAPQLDINSCGIASAIMILNTVYANIGKTPPIDKKGSWYVPEDNAIYGLFLWTENNFYNKRVDRIINKAVLEGDQKVKDQYLVGIELDRLTEALNLQGLNAKAYHVDNVDHLANFRKLVKRITCKPTKYMIVNYNLDIYAAQGGGHFSPLAAYDEESDSVLILDTWSASNSWIWIKLFDLYSSMNTVDGTVYRGYILIEAN